MARLEVENLADFIHKLRIVLKELNETSIWLRVIAGSRMVSPNQLMGLMRECTELCRIFTQSLKTARASNKRRGMQAIEAEQIQTSKEQEEKWQMKDEK